MSKPVIYIAGPVSRVPHYWEPFEAAEDEIRAHGFIPINPCWQPQGLNNAQYMRLCMAMLDIADAVLFLPGSGQSAGAQLEYSYCLYTGKPFGDSIETIKEVLGIGC